MGKINLRVIKLPGLKTTFIVFLLLVIISAGVFFGYQTYQESQQIIPQDVVKEALQKTAAAESYRFKATSSTLINGVEQPLTVVEGAKSAKGLYIKGEMLDTPVEIYQFTDKTYQKDPFSKKWIVIEGSDLAKMELLFSEINPFAPFNFKEIPEIIYLGIEKQPDNRKTYVFEFSPSVNNRYLEMFWSQVSYKIWVDKKSKLLVKAVVTGQGKSDSKNKLSMFTEFFDYNAKIKLEPPAVN